MPKFIKKKEKKRKTKIIKNRITSYLGNYKNQQIAPTNLH
jgi:hypothetical protein